jgi:poly-gamma-glutamate capsule biosynthesis protein CapA/YwtB (metallophosphatase superfamily)
VIAPRPVSYAALGLLAGVAVALGWWWGGREYVVVAVGDVNLAENVSPLLDEHGGGYPFEHVRELLEGDLLIGNLESVVTEHRAEGLRPDKPSIHEMEPRYLRALRDEGFDLLTLANNHAMDQGEVGLQDMLGHLDGVGIGRVGAGMDLAEARAAWIVEGRGVTLGVLGLCQSSRPLRDWDWFARSDRAGVYELRADELAADVAKLREAVDFVVATVHWRTYYSAESERTRAAARSMVEAGVDLVIGHGAHVAGGVELIEGVPVVYDLGNFTFGSWGNYERRSPDDRTSAVARYVFDGTELVRIELMPILTDNRIVQFQPRAAGRERAQREFEPDLDRYGVPWRLRDDGWYVVGIPPQEGDR